MFLKDIFNSSCFSSIWVRATKTHHTQEGEDERWSRKSHERISKLHQLRSHFSLHSRSFFVVGVFHQCFLGITLIISNYNDGSSPRLPLSIPLYIQIPPHDIFRPTVLSFPCRKNNMIRQETTNFSHRLDVALPRCITDCLCLRSLGGRSPSETSQQK